MNPLHVCFASALWIAAAAPGLVAAEPVTVSLTLKDHQFSPSSFDVPPGEKVRIVLTNRDAATEEFDSHDLRVEELVTPNGRTSFTIGPLRPGAYDFMGEFHPQTARGRVNAIESKR